MSNAKLISTLVIFLSSNRGVSYKVAVTGSSEWITAQRWLKIYGLCRIEEIPGLFVIGKPDMTVVAFGSDVVDIFEVNDIMSSKGWHLNALQRPNR